MFYLQSEVPDFKAGQSNTSPARNRRVNDNKKDVSKTAFKRNLFGDQEDQSPLVKQLIDSPTQPSLLIDPAIQSIKYNDFSYKMQPSEKEAKGTLRLLII